MRHAQDLLFFAYRDFTGAADVILEELGLGRAHHRAIHFIGRQPGITVGDLLAILRITKQSLARVLTTLVEQGLVVAGAGPQRPPAAAADPDRGRPGARAAAVRKPARAPRRRLPRGRRPGGGRLPPGHARHHGPGRAPGARQDHAAMSAAATDAADGPRSGGRRRRPAARLAVALPRRAGLPRHRRRRRRRGARQAALHAARPAGAGRDDAGRNRASTSPRACAASGRTCRCCC